jgi:hypothetical protein
MRQSRRALFSLKAMAHLARRGQRPRGAPGQGRCDLERAAECTEDLLQHNCLRPGHGEVKFAVSYKKGVAALQNEGVLEAAVKGHHGWYWKNRGKQPVEVELTTVGTPQSSGCCERRASQAVLAVTVGMQA